MASPVPKIVVGSLFSSIATSVLAGAVCQVGPEVQGAQFWVRKQLHRGSRLTSHRSISETFMIYRPSSFNLLRNIPDFARNQRLADRVYIPLYIHLKKRLLFLVALQ
jgi:hypothetical protein